MDASLEVAIAAQYGHGDETILLDGRANRFRQWPAVADTRRAAVSDKIKFQLVEVDIQTRRSEVVRNDFRAGRERRFHPWLHLQSALDGFFRQQARSEHQRWI